MVAINKKKRIVQIILILGVVALPLLYSWLYLGAFWDPYSRLNDLPVAIVNNDKGANINNTERDLGTELCDELKKDGTFKFVFTDETTATKGTKGNDYYAMLVIPTDFSSQIASSSSVDKQTAKITYSSNEKRNYLASQILSKATLEIEESLRSTVNKEITAQLSDKLEEVPNQLGKLQDGLSQLGDGSDKLVDGTNKLSGGSKNLANGASDLVNGTKQFSTKLNDYKAGVANSATGANGLSTGASSLDSGINQLLTGISAVETGTATLQQGASALANGASSFNTNLITYTAGVDTLIQTVNNTSAFLTSYVTAHPSLMADTQFATFITSMSDPALKQNIAALSAATTQLKTASATISAGINQIANSPDSIPKLQSAIAQIKNGLTQAKDGSAKLASGSKDLSTGLAAINSATQQLSSASKDITDGAAKVSGGAQAVNSGIGNLNKGAQQLNGGIETAKDSVNTAVTDANDKIKSLNGLDEFASKPVSIESQSINPVPNYGTAFAPYFLSLSLWVGAIIIFVGTYLDSENKFKLLSPDSNNKTLRTFAFLLIGFVQAVVLAIVLQICLGLHVNHVFLYFTSCCLVSMVFLSIVQFLMVFLKDIGKFLSLLLLILQLTSCGGTFPMETVPKFFNFFYPFMPMTYSVKLFKETISGGDTGAIWSNTLVLLAILVVFVGLTVVLSKAKNRNSSIEQKVIA